MNNTDPNTERIDPLNPCVVSLVTQWLEAGDENRWFHEVRAQFPNVDAFTLGKALEGYRRRHHLVHPAKLHRRTLRRKFDNQLAAVERGDTKMTVSLRAENKRRGDAEKRKQLEAA